MCLDGMIVYMRLRTITEDRTNQNGKDRLHKSGRAAAPSGIRPGLHPEGATAGDLVGGDAGVLLYGVVSGARAARAAGGGRASQRDSANEGGKTLPVLPEALAVGLWPGKMRL